MHPNIVQVLDVGEVGGALYLAMEYVHGKDLGNCIKKLQQNRTIMPLGEACYIVREVAQALHHAYWSTDMTGQRLSVVHRDVSPQNIILGYDGTIKLLDFGVAVSSVTENAQTMIVGKWLYMSPEATSNDQIDHRSDLFSLGVILYLLCSGYMPFTGRDPKEIVKKIRGGLYKPLQEIVAVPERLAALVSRLLSPNPDERPQRGQEVAGELTDIARQHGIESSSASISYILKQLFPNEGGVADQPVASAREITMGAEQTSSSATPAVDMSIPGKRSREYTVPPPSASHSIASGPVSTQHAIPSGPHSLASGPHGLPNSGPVLARTKSASSVPWQDVLPSANVKLTRSSVSLTGVIIAIAVIALLAVGLYLLVRPS
jgi:eukaryotic-like serine/threonine-protein kinase